jgi:hypothetical protein
MSAKTTPKKAKPKQSRMGPPLASAASTISMARQNLVNMAVVSTVSGAVLLGLLAARHF